MIRSNLHKPPVVTALAAVLLNSAAALAGESPSDAQALARALLADNAAARADVAVVLSPADAAGAARPEEQARRLLAGWPVAADLLFARIAKNDARATATRHDGEGTPGAGDPARAMILGKGTR